MSSVSFAIAAVIGMSLACAPVLSGAAGNQPSQQVLDLSELLAEQDIDVAMSGGNSMLGEALGIIAVEARTVAMDYLRNEVAANKAYQGKTAILRGRTLSIQAGSAGPFIEFAQTGEWGVRAYFQDRDSDDLARINRLDYVQVACRGAGVVVGVPIFKNCVMAATWRRSILAKVSRDVTDFLTARSSTPEAATIGTMATAIAGTLPSGADCDAMNAPCTQAMLAFGALPEQQQKNLIARAARQLKGRGIEPSARP